MVSRHKRGAPRQLSTLLQPLRPAPGARAAAPQPLARGAMARHVDPSLLPWSPASPLTRASAGTPLSASSGATEARLRALESSASSAAARAAADAAELRRLAARVAELEAEADRSARDADPRAALAEAREALAADVAAQLEAAHEAAQRADRAASASAHHPQQAPPAVAVQRLEEAVAALDERLSRADAAAEEFRRKSEREWRTVLQRASAAIAGNAAGATARELLTARTHGSAGGSPGARGGSGGAGVAPALLAGEVASLRARLAALESAPPPPPPPPPPPAAASPVGGEGSEAVGMRLEMLEEALVSVRGALALLAEERTRRSSGVGLGVGTPGELTGAAMLNRLRTVEDAAEEAAVAAEEATRVARRAEAAAAALHDAVAAARRAADDAPAAAAAAATAAALAALDEGEGDETGDETGEAEDTFDSEDLGGPASRSPSGNEHFGRSGTRLPRRGGRAAASADVALRLAALEEAVPALFGELGAMQQSTAAAARAAGLELPEMGAGIGSARQMAAVAAAAAVPSAHVEALACVVESFVARVEALEAEVARALTGVAEALQESATPRKSA